MKSFYWYDLETTGIDPKWDRIVQFAGLRTDLDLNPIGDEVCVYVALADDALPNPDASLVTGLTPQLINAQGISEWRALGQINGLFAQPQTCVAGYNSLRFDDEFMRYGLFRNLYDPYAREWQQGNSRWDLIDLVRATGALRRQGINWPTDETGLPVYKLESLTQANDLEHGQAHDAMSDVRATVAVAKLIQNHQPKLFSYYQHNASKKAVRKVLEPFLQEACVHVSGMYPRQQFGCAPVTAVCNHPSNGNSILIVDLSRDVEPLLDQSADELRESLFARNNDNRPGLKEIRINRCPFVAPIEVLNRENQERLNIDLAVVSKRLRQLRQPGFAQKIRQVYQGQRHPPTLDVDASLYDKFLTEDDRQRARSLHQELANDQWIGMDFEDERLLELSQRLKARSFPHLLTTDERQWWDDWVASKLHAGDAPWLTLSKFFERVNVLVNETELQAAGAGGAPKKSLQARLALLDQLKAYGEALRKHYPATDAA